MDIKNILIVFGTRPEIIKLAPLIIELRNSNNYKVTLCNTEQQKELSNQTLQFFNLFSDINLDIMEPNQKLTNLQAKILEKLNLEFNKIKYDAIVVQGDTMSAFCAALAGYYNKIPIFYLEAGLRSNNLNEPFPEEAIRQMMSRIATLFFTPTKMAFKNLIKDNISEKNIFLTGNTVIDALYYLTDNTKTDVSIFLKENNININKDFVLITFHRRENHGDRMDDIIKSIKILSNQFSNIDFIIPVHPNPNVKNKIYEELNDRSNIKLLDPLDYPILVELEKNAKLILTDSGGIQEEAPTFGCPVLVLRYETERIEGIKLGFAKLIGTDIEIILEESKKILCKSKKETRILKKKNPYGDGKSSIKIVKIINSYFNKSNLE